MKGSHPWSTEGPGIEGSTYVDPRLLNPSTCDGFANPLPFSALVYRLGLVCESVCVRVDRLGIEGVCESVCVGVDRSLGVDRLGMTGVCVLLERVGTLGWLVFPPWGVAAAGVGPMSMGAVSMGPTSMGPMSMGSVAWVSTFLWMATGWTGRSSTSIGLTGA